MAQSTARTLSYDIRLAKYAKGTEYISWRARTSLREPRYGPQELYEEPTSPYIYHVMQQRCASDTDLHAITHPLEGVGILCGNVLPLQEATTHCYSLIQTVCKARNCSVSRLLKCTCNVIVFLISKSVTRVWCNTTGTRTKNLSMTYALLSVLASSNVS